MVHLLFATIGTILIAITAIQPARANQIAVVPKITQKQVIKDTTPVKLVSLAYGGKLKGVSGFKSLLCDIAFGKISGKDLVQYGIDNGRLSPETINDCGYIKAVEYNLQELFMRRCLKRVSCSHDEHSKAYRCVTEP